MSKDKLVSVGEIRGAFGTGGMVKVRPLTDFPERFKGMREIMVQKGQGIELYEIESVSSHGDGLLFKFAGIDTREQACSLNAGVLKVTEADVFPLPEDYYYIFQLQGLKVYDDEQRYLGIITDVIQTGANDVYVVKGEQYGEILIPVIKEVVREISLEAGKVSVNLLPGLVHERTEPNEN